MRQRLVQNITGYYVIAGLVGLTADTLAGGPMPRWLSAFLLSIPVVAAVGQEIFAYFGKEPSAT